jgi:hypothetical protein
MSRIAFEHPDTAGPDEPGDPVAHFEVVLVDGSVERVDDAHAYQQEQSMTTFFRNDRGRQAVDSWSVRVASFRTDHILVIRRHEPRVAEVRHLQPA